MAGIYIAELPAIKGCVEVTRLIKAGSKIIDSKLIPATILRAAPVISPPDIIPDYSSRIAPVEGGSFLQK